MSGSALDTDVFCAIAEPRRREILAVLANGQEYAVNEVVLRMKVAQPSVSKHLGALRRAGMVTTVKRGQHRKYRLNPEGLKPLGDWVKIFERHWTDQMDDVKQRAEHKMLRRICLDDSSNRQKEDEWQQL